MTELAIPELAAGVEVSATHLTITDPSLTYEDFEALVARAALMGDSARWWLGDLLLFGEARYGELYTQVIEAARLSERQLTEYRYVCERVARSRRRGNLPFSYHREVAPLGPEEQEALLSRADEERWPREQLREAVRDARAVVASRPPSRPRQQVLDAPAVVDAARNLSTVKEALILTQGHLQDGHGRNDLAERLPRAMRAVEEAGATLRKAAQMPTLLDAARALVRSAVKQTGLADPAYIVPAKAIEELAALVAES
jgi:hypothetical protein